MYKTLFGAFLLLFAASCSEGQDVSGANSVPETPLGVWTGSIENHFGITELYLDVDQAEGGFEVTFNMMQTGRSWMTQNVVWQDHTLTFEIPLGRDPERVELRRDGLNLTGTWSSSLWDEAAQLNLVLDSDFAFPREERFVVEGEAGRLGGTLLIPEGEGPFPGVVYMHGSGDAPRTEGFYTGRYLASRGIMVATFDKRGAGESEGAWLETDFAGLARDGVVIAELLADHPLSDGEAIGFMGHSQAGWTVPLTASLWEPAAFALTRSGPAVPPATEGEWDYITSIKAAGYSESDVDDVLRIVRAWHASIETGDWDGYIRLRDGYRDRAWYEMTGFDNLPAPAEPEFAAWYGPVMRFNPVPVIESLDMPMLAIFGLQDESINAVESVDILQSLADEGHDIQILTYDGYDHGIRQIQTEPPIWRAHPDDYLERQAQFILNSTGYGH